MWRWHSERKEPIGEPPPTLDVTPSEVNPGEELSIEVLGPPGGVFEVEFELAPAAAIEALPPPPEGPPVTIQPLPPVEIHPLPGNPPAPHDTPPVTAPTVSHATASAQDMPKWADDIANVIALALVFYGMVAAAMAANIKFGWLVTLAMMGIVWYFRDVIITPLQGLIKGIILIIFHVVIEILDFVWQWIQGVLQFFGGDLVRAVLQTLMVASFLWIWEQASQIPVIGQLFQWIENTAQTVLSWVETQIAGLQSFFDGIRRGLEADVANLTKGLGDLGDELRNLLDRQLDALFSRVQTTITGLRAEVLGQLQGVVMAANLQAGVFAAAFHLSPETARNYLRAYARNHPREALADTAGVLAAAAPGALNSGDFRATPWTLLDEFIADLGAIRRGVQHDADDWVKEAIQDIRALAEGNTPAVEPLAQELIDKLTNDAQDPLPVPVLPDVPLADIPPVEAGV